MADLKKTLMKANQSQTQNTQPKGGTVLELIQQMIPQVKKALPSHLNAERLVRIVTTEIRRTPQLLSCSKESLLGALMLSAQLGLEPGPLGHCYYVPYKNQVQFIIGYKGMIDLSRRSGQISVIYAETVHENDYFEYELGLEPKLVHKPSLKERGNPIAWYGVCRFKDGGFFIKIMGKEEIERHRIRSLSVNSAHSPWNTDYEEMAKKTVIRAMFKYLPVSPEILEVGLPDEGLVKVQEKSGEIVVDMEFQTEEAISLKETEASNTEASNNE